MQNINAFSPVIHKTNIFKCICYKNLYIYKLRIYTISDIFIGQFYAFISV